MSLIRRCERCMGTGELESSDSTEDVWWDCGTCKGTGKIEFEDRRAPDTQLAGAVETLLFYADPATWDTISEHGTVTTKTLAVRDGGDRARRALGDQS